MRDRILEIVVLMVDYIQEKRGQLFSSEELSSTLKTLGYSDLEISSAYMWLVERFDDTPEQHFANFGRTQGSNRVLTDLESSVLSAEAHGYILKLLGLSLIDQAQFESVLERAALFAIQPVELDQIKLIVSALLFRDAEDIDRFTRDDSNNTSIFIN